MKRFEVEVYSEDVNTPVLRFPGRRFPGSLIQGDSLSILCDMAETVCAGLASSADENLRVEAEMLRDQLIGRLEHYKSTLASAGLELPFGKRS